MSSIEGLENYIKDILNTYGDLIGDIVEKSDEEEIKTKVQDLNFKFNNIEKMILENKELDFNVDKINQENVELTNQLDNIIEEREKLEKKVEKIKSVLEES